MKKTTNLQIPTGAMKSRAAREFLGGISTPTLFRLIRRGLLKSRAAREFLGGISTPTLFRLIRRGLLRPNRSTRHLLFDVNELQRFLRDGMAD